MAKVKDKAKVNRTKVPKGDIVIIPERCKGCGICIEFCPKKVLAFSKEYNAKGYYFPCVDKPQECTACNMCSLLCPDFAIYLVHRLLATKERYSREYSAVSRSSNCRSTKSDKSEADKDE